MASHSWARKLFTAPKPRPFRNARNLERPLALETLEERVTPADLVYTATAVSPAALTLLLAGPDLQIVNAAVPTQVLASKALTTITTGVRIDGAGFNLNLAVDAGVPQVGGVRSASLPVQKKIRASPSRLSPRRCSRCPVRNRHRCTLQGCWRRGSGR